MSEHIEWSELRHTAPHLLPEGEIRDGFGNQNDLPALALYSAALEGTPGQWHTFALGLLDEANRLLAEEADESEPRPSIQTVVDAAREALTAWAQEDDGDALASAVRLVLLALAPEVSE